MEKSFEANDFAAALKEYERAQEKFKREVEKPFRKMYNTARAVLLEKVSDFSSKAKEAGIRIFEAKEFIFDSKELSKEMKLLFKGEVDWLMLFEGCEAKRLPLFSNELIAQALQTWPTDEQFLVFFEEKRIGAKSF